MNRLRPHLLSPTSKALGLPSLLIATAISTSGCQAIAPAPVSAVKPAPVEPQPLQFVTIPAGCFEMGASSAPSQGRQPSGPRKDELPRHRVCLDSFRLGAHEVTRAQWFKVMGGTPPAPEHSRLPQGRITWESAQQFLMRLNQHDASRQYRLPTEAEWEYACLAGSDESGIRFNTEQHGLELQQTAWYNEPTRSEDSARPVGELQPNAWGLYDMLGNLWEWTSDSYREDGYSLHAVDNPRVEGAAPWAIRGGSYTSQRFQVRCGGRNFALENDPLPTQGLRLVEVVASQPTTPREKESQ